MTLAKNIDKIIVELETLRDDTQEAFDILLEEGKEGVRTDRMERRLDIIDSAIDSLRLVAGELIEDN
jgi:hypothetical protein